jgi:2',3'-cyclic-nucleotide 2'-phosphodiesterase (5'-nucleotidase family)
MKKVFNLCLLFIIVVSLSACIESKLDTPSLVGEDKIVVEVFSDYQELGTNYDSEFVKINGTVDTTVLGVYELLYVVTVGDEEVVLKRTVEVVDLEKPVISLTGGDVTMKEGEVYTDSSVTAYDNYDGDISSSVVVSGSVDTSTVGVYVLTYSVTDSSGNVGDSVSRSVTVVDSSVVDTTKPVIDGALDITVLEGTFFDLMLGVTASDDFDGNITSSISISGEYNSSVPGVYHVSYTVSDSSGNQETVNRTITVLKRDLIGDVKSGTVGSSYVLLETVAFISPFGFVLTNGSEYLFVYTSSTPSVNVGEKLFVEGTSSLYGGSVQLTNADYGFYDHGSYVDNREAKTYTGSEIDALSLDFNVGEYVSLTGTVSISGNYINLSMDGTSILGTLQVLGSVNDYLDYNNKEVTVTGYLLYFSGSNRNYMNIILESIDEGTTVVSEDITFSILTVNDLHGYILQDDDGTNGISNMEYLINQIREEKDGVVLIGNGDMFQGTAVSNMTEGLAVIEVMNLMDFDVMGIGNHEFDWGIETVLQYFDNDESNGEADFPLLNANIYNKSDDSLLTVIGGNVFESTMIEKNGVKVGIISYVGDVYNSISQDKVSDVYFDLNIEDSVSLLASSLRDNGANLVVVNIHGGYSTSITNYLFNQEIASLTDGNGKYLVDVVINGHTHSTQADYISRANGQPLLLVQASSYGNAFGHIEFTLDKDTLEIKTQMVSLEYTSYAGTNYDPAVEEYIQEALSNLGDQTLVTAGETVTYTNMLYEWSSNVYLKATGADVIIMNNGCVRSTGNITAGEGVKLSQLYEISPFDNNIFLITATYQEMKNLMDSSAVYYNLKDGITLDPNQTYTFAVISYVYYWDQLADVRSDLDIDTNLFMRDLLILDLETKGQLGLLFEPFSNPEAHIALQYEETVN